MKKRFTVVLALGISFAPPAFAGKAFIPRSEGEKVISQMDGAAIFCDRLKQPELGSESRPSDKSAPSKSVSGGAGQAGSAS